MTVTHLPLFHSAVANKIYASCGRVVDEERTHKDPRKTTCRSCRQSVEWTMARADLREKLKKEAPA